jgi:hypothetical protein
MAEDKEVKQKGEASGWVVLEFTSLWGTKKKGDKETYHQSTANALVERKVAKVSEVIEKYVPKAIVK